MRKVGSRQQGPPAKRRNWTKYWRCIVGLTWWLNVWKGKKKHYYYQVTFIFVFRPKMNVHFCFVFGRKWNFIFVGIFIYGRKSKMLFNRPLVYITKRSWSWSWDAWSWSWSWTLGLDLVLVLKLRSWSWSWKKVLITSLYNKFTSSFTHSPQWLTLVTVIYAKCQQLTTIANCISL